MSVKFDITSFDIDLLYKLPETHFNKLINKLSDAQISLKPFTEQNFNLKDLSSLFPAMTWYNEDRSVRVELTTTRLTVNIGPKGRIRTDPIKNMFSKESLLKVSNDVNFVVGLLLGQIQPSELPSIEGFLSFSSKNAKLDFNHLLNDVIDKSIKDSHLIGIDLQRSEDLWGSPSLLTYSYMQRDNVANGRLSFSLKQNLPINLYDLIEELHIRFENITQKVAKE
jgi:hypothetical protein